MDSPARDRAVRAFLTRYGHAPSWIAVAPGRVNLIGEHTDYNDGFVLPMAIDRHTAVAAAPTADRTAVMRSRWADEDVSLDLTTPQVRGLPQWANYLRGVIDGFQARHIAIPGFRAVIESDVPTGGGLSSSAALEVSVATLLEALTGHRLDPLAKALLCQRAEREFAGVPSGIMDQVVSAMATAGHALLIDCRALSITPMPMHDPAITILVVNTNVRHDLADGEYATRHAQCRDAAAALGVPALRDATLEALDRAALAPDLRKRARHVVTENARTLAAASALRAGDWGALGQLMYASHASLREDYAVSCPELDLIVDTAADLGPASGILGARMTGGGFGGSAVCLVRTEELTGARRLLSEAYAARVDRAATWFSFTPAGGASVLPCG